MVTQEQGFTAVEGLNVYDVILMTQAIDKLLGGGLVSGKEVNYVAAIRTKLLSSVNQAIQVDLDNIQPVKAKDNG